jgi:subtilisin family serine protease/subtilisin-like proprotein convertase family protein
MCPLQTDRLRVSPPHGAFAPANGCCADASINFRAGVVPTDCRGGAPIDGRMPRLPAVRGVGVSRLFDTVEWLLLAAALSSVIAVVSRLSSPISTSAASASTGAPWTGRFYVWPKADVTQADLEIVVERLGGHVDYRFKLIEALSISVDPLQFETLVARAEIGAIEPVPTATLHSELAPYPMVQTRATSIWDADGNGRPDPNAIDGGGIGVCVIDTGIMRDHRDFLGVAMTGESMVPSEPWHSDLHGHGTHVAGIIAAAANGGGIVGQSPGAVRLHVIKVFDFRGDWGSQADLSRAVESCWSAGADIINMSLGVGHSNTLAAVLDELHENHDVLLVAAAGNTGGSPELVPDYLSPRYPAHFGAVMSVGAVDAEARAAALTVHPPPSASALSPPRNGAWDATEVSGGGVDVPSSFPGVEFLVDGAAVAAVRWAGSAAGDATGPLVDGGVCQSSDVSATWRGGVVLCRHGSPSIHDQVRNAVGGAAAAVVVYNNYIGGLVTHGEPYSSMPVVTISDSAGQRLRAGFLGRASRVRYPSSGVEWMSGTSMAAPSVAGAAALVWQACGGPEELDARELRLLLRDSAQDLQGVHPGSGLAYGPGYDPVTGWGLVQVTDAIELGVTRFGEQCFHGLRLQPERIAVCRSRGSDVMTTEVAATLAYRNRLDLMLPVAPPGVTIKLAPATLTGGDTRSVLSVDTGAAAPGLHDLVIKAADPSGPSGAVARASLSLDIAEVAPRFAPMPTLPGDRSMQLALRPMFEWQAVSGVRHYRLQISDHADFRNVVQDVEVDGTRHALSSSLQGGRTYYWRVAARNGCGDSAFSTARVFSTEAFQCMVSGAAMPEGGSASSSLTFTAPGQVGDVRVMVQLAHSRIGDVRLNLEHVESGRSARLVTDVKSDGLSSCPGADIDVLLTDGASVQADLACERTSPSLSGELAPTDPLAVFAGMAQSGTWRLTAVDATANGHTGALQSWCLHSDSQAPQIAEQRFSVLERSPNGTLLGRLSASDGDAGDRIGFEIVGGSGADAFVVDPVSGDLRVSRTNGLDYERMPAMDLLVQARDLSGNVAYARVTIELVNVEEPPRFERRLFTVTDDARAGVALGTLDAVDPEGETTTLRYRVVGGSGAAQFAVSKYGGDLMLREGITLDARTSPPLELEVEVTDSTRAAFRGWVDIHVVAATTP